MFTQTIDTTFIRLTKSHSLDRREILKGFTLVCKVVAFTYYACDSPVSVLLPTFDYYLSAGQYVPKSVLVRSCFAQYYFVFPIVCYPFRDELVPMIGSVFFKNVMKVLYLGNPSSVSRENSHVSLVSGSTFRATQCIKI